MSDHQQIYSIDVNYTSTTTTFPFSKTFFVCYFLLLGCVNIATPLVDFQWPNRGHKVDAKGRYSYLTLSSSSVLLYCTINYWILSQNIRIYVLDFSLNAFVICQSNMKQIINSFFTTFVLFELCMYIDLQNLT